MLITLVAILIANGLIFLAPVINSFSLIVLVALIVLGGTVILILSFLLNTLILGPLGKLEQKLIPNLLELVRLDRPLKIGRYFLFLFPLLSYLCAILLTIEQFPHREWLVAGWVIAFGLSLDLILDCWKRLVNFLNPSHLVNYLTKAAKKAVAGEKDSALWRLLDSLAEIGLRAVERSKIALGSQALQAFPSIIQSFFTSSKSISRVNQDAKIEKETGKDEASFTIFYLLQRLELINDRALQKRLETICRQMIMSMGKIVVYSAKYDLSMVSFPTHFLTKFGLKAQQHHFDEVGVLTTSTLLEIAKTIVTDIDTTYAELQDPFRAIINGLEALTKATFKKNKQTNIAVLVQPFEELRKLFQTEKMVNHRDTPTILLEINRVLEEYAALDEVMRAMPSIPDLTKDIADSNLETPTS
jgi:hypothetical protein